MYKYTTTKGSDYMFRANSSDSAERIKSNEELLQDAITEHKMKAIRSDILDNLTYILDKIDNAMTRKDYNAIIKISEAIDKLTAEI